MDEEIKSKYSLEEIYQQLIQRDAEDEEIGKANRQKLIEKGLQPIVAGRYIRIVTDEIKGADKVASHLVSHISGNDKVVALQGLSGVGKGTTANALKNELSGLVFSFGEVFRYLTFQEYYQGEKDHGHNLSQIYHELVDGRLDLHRSGKNLSYCLKSHLHDPKLSCRVPSISAKTQDLVIRFIHSEIGRVKKRYNQVIILEGRDYTLDFLPCDLRIELCADPMVRAERRLNQEFS